MMIGISKQPDCDNFTQLKKAFKPIIGVLKPPDCDELAQLKADYLNSLPGDLGDVDCPICRNRGQVWIAYGDEILSRKCECAKARQSLRLIRLSGLGDLVKGNTFDTFRTPGKWQQEAKEKALAFASQGKPGWFAMLGNSGAGKTHLCTAICGMMLKENREVRYMVWRTESERLKSLRNDPAFQTTIKDFCNAEVLYIDDLFKTKQGAEITPADVGLAFDIINCRANNPSLTTIVSSEKTMQELLTIDEAVGGRIYEKCGKDFRVEMVGREKNYRLRRGGV